GGGGGGGDGAGPEPTKPRAGGLTDPSIPKLPNPPVPDGMTVSKMGKDLIGWGQGPNGALDRLIKITRESVAEMQSNGLTREIAEGWRNKYANEFARNANNLTAGERKRLLEKIISLME
ncbi:DUF4951 domain-containing protein, partial [Neogemmobacter tilapiae]|uniref:DUF4951 domain-containing protein n=1 Tax=Neogemmobacter tilapiae TaxID=875041 RepID=UPI001E2E51D9